MIRTLGALALLALLAGCVGEREVKVALPISRLELPEVGPRKFDIGVATTAKEQAVLTRDQANTPPDPTAPDLSEQNDGLLRFDANLHPLVNLSAKASGGLAGIQAKLMPLRDRGPVSLAVTLAVAGGNDRFDFNDGTVIARTDTRSRLSDGALILGWSPAPDLLIYGGPWFSRLRYHGHHFSDRGSNPDFETDYAGQLTARGGNLGLATTFRRWGRLLFEYSRATVKGGSNKDEVGRAALALEIFFGSVTRPERQDEPVKVVPVEAPARAPRR